MILVRAELRASTNHRGAQDDTGPQDPAQFDRMLKDQDRSAPPQQRSAQEAETRAPLLRDRSYLRRLQADAETASPEAEKEAAALDAGAIAGESAKTISPDSAISPVAGAPAPTRPAQAPTGPPPHAVRSSSLHVAGRHRASVETQTAPTPAPREADAVPIPLQPLSPKPEPGRVDEAKARPSNVRLVRDDVLAEDAAPRVATKPRAAQDETQPVAEAPVAANASPALASDVAAAWLRTATPPASSDTDERKGAPVQPQTTDARSASQPAPVAARGLPPVQTRAEGRNAAPVESQRSPAFPRVEQAVADRTTSRREAAPVDAPATRRAVKVSDVRVATHLPALDPVRQIVDRVASTVSETTAAVPSPAPEAGPALVKTLHMKLEPESLGAVTVRMRLTGGNLSIRLDVAEPQTLEMLRRDSARLETSLSNGAVQVESLAIHRAGEAAAVASSGSSSSSSGSGEQPSSRSDSQSERREGDRPRQQESGQDERQAYAQRHRGRRGSSF